MALGDTESKVKIKVEAEMDDAIAAFAKLKREQEQTAKQTKLVGDKFSELGKSMVGLQMHDTFNKLSKSVGEATGNMVDLNGAFAGYQAAGIYGAAIGALTPVIAKMYGGLKDAFDITGQFTEGLKELNEESKKTGGNGGLGGLYRELKKVSDEHANFRETLMGAFRQGVASAKEYEKSIKDVLAVSKTLVSDIERIAAAANGPSDLDLAIQGIKNRKNAAPRQFASGFFDGVTGKAAKQSKASGGSAPDKPSTGMEGEFPWGEADAISGGRLNGGLFPNGGFGSMIRQEDTEALTKFNEQALLTIEWRNKLADFRAKDQSFMEQTFGKLGEVDLYKSAFDGLTGAVTSGYNAMIDGTMSFGAAFKKSIADALKALGGQMLVESLKETAYGIRDLANYNYGGAALHFKSAAGFAVGAVAAGVVSSQLGGGGGASAPGGGGSAPSVSPPSGGTGSGGGQQQSGPTYIIQTNPWSNDDTPRMKRNQIDKLLARSSQGRN